MQPKEVLVVAMKLLVMAKTISEAEACTSVVRDIIVKANLSDLEVDQCAALTLVEMQIALNQAKYKEDIL
tara:strand:+ start:140 stop:349 length:210 start_codon:yes stop_codon:yes gene_type:complete